MKIAMHEIMGNENIRTSGDVKGLAGSMDLVGQLEPIGIRWITADGGKRPQVMYGARRLLAAETLGWKEIDCVEVPLASRAHTVEARVRAQGAENIGRQNMTLAEQGRAALLLRAGNDDDDAIAAAFGVTKKHIQNVARFVSKIDPTVLVRLEAADMSFRAYAAVAKLEGVSQQTDLALDLIEASKGPRAASTPRSPADPKPAVRVGLDIAIDGLECQPDPTSCAMLAALRWSRDGGAPPIAIADALGTEGYVYDPEGEVLRAIAEPEVD